MGEGRCIVIVVTHERKLLNELPVSVPADLTRSLDVNERSQAEVFMTPSTDALTLQVNTLLILHS